MSYTRSPRQSYRAPLTPPADLVGRLVSWRPKMPDGTRRPVVYGTVTGHDPTPGARTLTIEVSQVVSPWQPNPTRTVTIPLAHGPFTLASAS